MSIEERAPSCALLLRRARQATGLTQEALAERAHLSVRAVSDLERGLNLRPRKDTLALLADALALSPQERAAFEDAARRQAGTQVQRPLQPRAARGPCHDPLLRHSCDTADPGRAHAGLFGTTRVELHGHTTSFHAGPAGADCCKA